MKKLRIDSKINLAFITGIFFLLILGCQPEKGKLVALPSEEVEIVTSEIGSDTAQIKNDDLTIKVNGRWSAAIGFEINVKNSGSKEFILDLGEMNLVNAEKEKTTIGDITENQNNNFTYIRHARVNEKENQEKAPDIGINPKENRQFTIVFSKPFDSATDDEAKRTLYLTFQLK